MAARALAAPAPSVVDPRRDGRQIVAEKGAATQCLLVVERPRDVMPLPVVVTLGAQHAVGDDVADAEARAAVRAGRAAAPRCGWE